MTVHNGVGTKMKKPQENGIVLRKTKFYYPRKMYNDSNLLTSSESPDLRTGRNASKASNAINANKASKASKASKPRMQNAKRKITFTLRFAPQGVRQDASSRVEPIERDIAHVIEWK